MKKTKYFIMLIICFIAIGIASLCVTLNVFGDVVVFSDIEEFKIYFSDVKVNNVSKMDMIKDGNKFFFTTTLNNLDEEYIITYDIKNDSKYFDANISLKCIGFDEYISITNEFDKEIVKSFETTSGTLKVKKIKTNSSSENRKYDILCTIETQPIEVNNNLEI